MVRNKPCRPVMGVTALLELCPQTLQMQSNLNSNIITASLSFTQLHSRTINFVVAPEVWAAQPKELQLLVQEEACEAFQLAEEARLLPERTKKTTTKDTESRLSLD